jgi:hypothetical protein
MNVDWKWFAAGIVVGYLVLPRVQAAVASKGK